MIAMSNTSSANRCRGVMIGLAAGDRNGGPIRMAVRLAESLHDCGGFDPADILDRYLTWWKAGAFDTGPVSDGALALIAAGWHALQGRASGQASDVPRPCRACHLAARTT